MTRFERMVLLHRESTVGKSVNSKNKQTFLALQLGSGEVTNITTFNEIFSVKDGEIALVRERSISNWNPAG